MRIFLLSEILLGLYLLLNQKNLVLCSGGTATGRSASNDSDFKFYKEDPNDATKTVEVENSNYNVTKANLIEYEFKEGSNCTLVKYGDKEVWKYDSSNNGSEYPKNVFILEGNWIIVDFGEEGEAYFFENDNLKIDEHSKKCSQSTTESTQGGSTHTSGGLTTNLKGTDGSTTKEIKFYTKDSSDDTKLTELDSGMYEKKEENGFEVKFKDDAKCTFFKCDNKEVWKYDSSKHSGQYPQKINILKDNWAIFEFGDKGDVYEFQNNEWKFNEEFTKEYNDMINEATKREAVELSIKDTSTTDQYTYEKKGNVVTFTVKEGFGFSSVKTKKGGCSGCCKSDVTIWESANESEYATKVVLEGKGNKKKTVTIHLGNGSTKVFKRQGKGKPWNESS